MGLNRCWRRDGESAGTESSVSAFGANGISEKRNAEWDADSRRSSQIGGPDLRSSGFGGCIGQVRPWRPPRRGPPRPPDGRSHEVRCTGPSGPHSRGATHLNGRCNAPRRDALTHEVQCTRPREPHLRGAMHQAATASLTRCNAPERQVQCTKERLRRRWSAAGARSPPAPSAPPGTSPAWAWDRRGYLRCRRAGRSA